MKGATSQSGSIRLFVLLGCLSALGIAWFVWAILMAPRGYREIPDQVAEGFRPGAIHDLQCISCHQEAHEGWANSHHHLANRLLDPGKDKEAFHDTFKLEIAGTPSVMKKDRGAPLIQTLGPEGDLQSFYPDMVLAYDPLHQYLIPFPGGRWQATDLAWEPETQEWFNVYGDQNRRPDEWGSWSNRANTWNSNCAWCHMTGFQKNYEIENDSFSSKWDQMGISCTQCHSDMAAHLKNPSAPVPRIDYQLVQDNCASCHSRRSELTLDFRVGDKYNDHFRVSTPAELGLYYPDGQIRDEVFVHASFAMSTMGHSGVHCLDCHDAHSYELTLPIENNALCMKCHSNGGGPGSGVLWTEHEKQVAAPVVSEIAHSFHPSVNDGGPSCVDCHMTQTYYMERDPRRDHGYHIPDPLLTVKHKVPNACNKCHTDESPEWALEWTEKWYGERMERDTRERALLIARAYDREVEVIPELVQFAREKEKIPFWQATLVELANNLALDESAISLARDYLEHEDPVVRAAAVRSLGENPDYHPSLLPLLNDPVRLVRIDAAWALRERLIQEEKVGLPEEVMNYFMIHADQPSGAARLGQLAFLEGKSRQAEEWYLKAIKWDPYSWPLYSELAVMRSIQGNQAAAMKILKQGIESNPEIAGLHYYLALSLAESGNIQGAHQSLNKAVELDPDFSRAWYNLALTKSQMRRPDESIQAINQAIRLEPENPQFYYTRATLYLQIDQSDLARRDLERVNQLQPDNPQVQQLLQSLRR
ncbi:MAG: tetratricopeptide repeat protein [Verrucomicrobiota bacterium]